MRTLHLHILCDQQPDSVTPALVHSPAGRDACTAAQSQAVLEAADITAASGERRGKNLKTSLRRQAVYARRRAAECPRVHISACR